MKKLLYAIMLLAQTAFLPHAAHAQEAAESAQPIAYARVYNDQQLLYEMYVGGNAGADLIVIHMIKSAEDSTYIRGKLINQSLCGAAVINESIFSEYVQQYNEYLNECEYGVIHVDCGEYKVDYFCPRGMEQLPKDFFDNLPQELFINSLACVYRCTNFERDPIEIDVSSIDNDLSHKGSHLICIDNDRCGIRGYCVLFPDIQVMTLAGYFLNQDPITYHACVISKPHATPRGRHIENPQEVYEALKSLYERTLKAAAESDVANERL